MRHRRKSNRLRFDTILFGSVPSFFRIYYRKKITFHETASFCRKIPTDSGIFFKKIAYFSFLEIRTGNYQL